MNQFMISYRC